MVVVRTELPCTCEAAPEIAAPADRSIVLAARCVVPLKARPLAALPFDRANIAHSCTITANLNALAND